MIQAKFETVDSEFHALVSYAIKAIEAKAEGKPGRAGMHLGDLFHHSNSSALTECEQDLVLRRTNVVRALVLE